MIMTLVCYECSLSDGYYCNNGVLHGELVTCTGVCIKIYYTKEGEAFCEIARNLKIMILSLIFQEGLGECVVSCHLKLVAGVKRYLKNGPVKWSQFNNQKL